MSDKTNPAPSDIPLSEALGIPQSEMEALLNSTVKEFGGKPCRVDDVIDFLLKSIGLLLSEHRKAAAVGYYVALENLRGMQESGMKIDLTGEGA